MASNRWAALLIALAVAAGGCSGAGIRPARSMPLLEDWQASIGLADELSPRTRQTLRQHDLEELYSQKPADAYHRLQLLAVHDPQPEVLFALAEMSYFFGQRHEKSSSASAVAFYYFCAGYSYHYLFDPLPQADETVATSTTTPVSLSPFEPRFRLACDLYNASLAKCIQAAQKTGRLDPRQQLHVGTADGQGYTLSVQHHGFAWKPEEFGPLLPCADYEVVGLDNLHHTYGLGVPLIGTRVQAAQVAGPTHYPNEVGFPVTAFFRFEGALADMGTQRAGKLELYNPLTIQTVEIHDRQVPLETDLTTPLAYFLSKSDLQRAWVEGFLSPEKLQARSGIYMFEPYQPGKIPVIMVHGLLSSPLTWLPMFNDLRADPELREHFQFWFFLYPTGDPYLQTAADLRHALSELRVELDPEHRDSALDDMVLVGHSMGGLLSRLLTVDSGDDFWRLVSPEPFSEVKAQPQSREELQHLFFFERLPGVRRLVFIGTPHRGSALSHALPGRLAAKLIQLPTELLTAAQDLTKENPQLRTDRIPNSVDLLAPASPALKLLAGEQRPVDVHWHSIIGQAPANSSLRELTYPFADSGPSDGVVPYSSAHLDDADSELVVPADHFHVHQVQLAVQEVRRILREHLRDR